VYGGVRGITISSPKMEKHQRGQELGDRAQMRRSSHPSSGTIVHFVGCSLVNFLLYMASGVGGTVKEGAARRGNAKEQKIKQATDPAEA